MLKPETVQKVKNTIKRRSDYEYFFNQLKSAVWVKPLFDAGFFSAPEKPIHEGNYVRFPFWPESRYLTRMAALAPEIVVEVALQIPDTENVRVHEDLADIALSVPQELSIKFLPKIEKWLESPYQLILPEKLGKLISYLVKGGKIKEALELTRILLAVQSDPKDEEKIALGKSKSFTFPPEPRPRFDKWDYEQILKKNIPDLIKAEGKATLELFCELLSTAIKLSRRDKTEEGTEDYSFVWRSAIEEHEQNYGHGLDELLLTEVRDIAEQIIKTEVVSLPEIIKFLEGQKWNVFHRIALHLLRVFPQNVSELIREHLTNEKYFDEAYRHEYALLARDHFATLSNEDKDNIFKWAAETADSNTLKEFYKQRMNREPTEDEIKAYQKSGMVRRLAIFRHALPQEWKQKYDELVAELGEPAFPEFVTYHTTAFSPEMEPSDIIEKLTAMTVEKIADFLKTWKPKGKVVPSPLGIEAFLRNMASKSPQRFARWAGSFKEVHSTLIDGLMMGLYQGIKNKQVIEWGPVLDLCEWAVKQPREINNPEGSHKDLDTHWGGAWQGIARLLTAGFENGPTEIPVEFRKRVWDILEPITDDPNPTQEYEKEYGTSLRPADVSINTTRGEAMQAVVQYALWVRRHLEKLPDSKKRIAHGFKEMPEVQKVLDAHLDVKKDPSLAIRAVYGQWFPWLVLMDKKWAKANVKKIFPSDDALKEFRDAAWYTYLAFCKPYDIVFEILQGIYMGSVVNMNETSATKYYHENVNLRLAEHLVEFYWRGKFKIKDSMLKLFFALKGDELQSHVIAYVGQSLHDAPVAVSEKIIKRLKTLWNFVNNQGGYPENVLAQFGWWFASGKFADVWSLKQLEKVLVKTGKLEPMHIVLERLAELATMNPRQVIKCLALIEKKNKENLDFRSCRDEARKVLETVLQGKDAVAKKNAIDIVHRFGARGWWEFRELITEKQENAGLLNPNNALQ